MVTPYQGHARIEPESGIWASDVALTINDIDSDSWIATHVARIAIKEATDRYRVVLLSGEAVDREAEATVGYDQSDDAIVTLNGKTPFTDDQDDISVTAALVVKEAARHQPHIAADGEAGDS